jgi:hypothetical protein
MAENVLARLLREKNENDIRDALFQSGGLITLAKPQVEPNDIRGEDPFQAQLNDLKKLPSTTPRINDETRSIYNKYNKFLNFAGAATNDYSGAKSFQSGISSALDMGMIQDLLEEQRDLQLSGQFHEILPHIKNESQLRSAIGALNMTLPESRSAQQLWKDYRPDWQQDIDQMTAMKMIAEYGGDAFVRQMRKDMPSGMNQVDTRQWLELKLRYLPPGVDRTKVEEAIERDFEWGGGGDYTPEDFWMPHKVDLAGVGETGRKEVRSAIDHLKLTGYWWDGKKENKDILRFNPTRIQNVNIKDASNLQAMETLKRHGVVPINVNMQGSQVFRMTQDGLPVGGIIQSNNPYAMAYAEEYKRSDSSGRLGFEQNRPDWEDRYWAIGKTERDKVTLQVQHMNMVAALAEKGMTVANMAGMKGAVKFSAYHLGQLAEDMGQLFGPENPLRSVVGNIQYINTGRFEQVDTGRKDANGQPIMETREIIEVAPDSIEALSKAYEQQAELEVRKIESAEFAEGTSEADKKKIDTMRDDWRTSLNKFAKDARNVDKMRTDKEYSARILLGFVEAALRAQVARMYIDKDRMLASFYNEMKNRINLTGWLQTESGAESVLQNVANEANDRAESKRHLITRYADPEYQLTTGGMPAGGAVTQSLPGLSTQGVTEQQRMNQIRVEAGLPPL